MPELLCGSDLVKSFGTTRALDGVSVSVCDGESVAIVRPSGSGKSTLLHVLAGVLTPDDGDVALRGDSLARMSDRQRTLLRRSTFGFAFQFGQLLPELTAVENAALPLMPGGVRRRDAVARAGALFAPLGLDGLQDRRPGELPGGQAQRVAVARALVTAPPCPIRCAPR
ncbi:ATP-binding cassette domain-containing protein [Rhodococcus sp. D2-41]|nr:ATP-binding cassette domain-containing protein [Rhodococcus sp. D2-41]